jgi:hypothetical protein
LKTDLKAILFDFAGTLDSDGIAWKERFYPIYRAHGFRWGMAQFERYFFASDDFLTDLGLTQVGYLDTVRIQVGLVLREAGCYTEAKAEHRARVKAEAAAHV